MAPIFARIGKRFGRHISGKPMLLHYDTEYREDDADYEACMPVRAGKPVDEISDTRAPRGTLRFVAAQGTLRPARAVLRQDSGLHPRQGPRVPSFPPARSTTKGRE